jgi:MoaA/NifB/PqqE/SkfB family radical SAM enzyme
MNIPSLRYTNKDWNINLPSIRAYTFDKREIDVFIRGGEVPLDFDTNLTGGCNADCIYCATRGGKSDIRFADTGNLPSLADEDLSNIMNQLSHLGTRTFFLCSNGEPLLDSGRFLKIIDRAGDINLNIITYTNGTTLDKSLLKELHKRKVNLVMKLESFNPNLNDSIVLGKNKHKTKYSYGILNNQKVPTGIIEALSTYNSDSDCLGIETMILKQNLNEILDIREWSYQLGISQFLKHLYPLGYAKIKGKEIIPGQEDEEKLEKDILAMDLKKGFVYPLYSTPDNYSYDVRRFMNNCLSNNDFPFRMFAHEAGGVYHSSPIIPLQFGFGTGKVISIFNTKGKIDMKNYFEKIKEALVQ